MLTAWVDQSPVLPRAEGNTHIYLPRMWLGQYEYHPGREIVTSALYYKLRYCMYKYTKATSL